MLPLKRFFQANLYDLPCPLNISYAFAVGSLLAFFYLLQVITGLSLAFTYESRGAFTHRLIVTQDINSGWLFRVLHANGASFLFCLLLLHLGRGLLLCSYRRIPVVWLTGYLLFLFIRLTAFTGYVLPWGQISYWAATVILNLFSTLPILGESLVTALWGGPVVSPVTVSRLFTVHFFLPLALLLLLLLHLQQLHQVKSSNPFGLPISSNKELHPLFRRIDLCSFCFVFFFFLFLCLGYPFLFGIPENFQRPTPLATPSHIIPEWYFLPFYAVLRCVPHKRAGVLLILLFLLTLFCPSFYHSRKLSPFIIFCLVFNFFILLWLGGTPLFYPFPLLSLIHCLTHFLLLFTPFIFL